jgi:hypothetical protein
MVCSAQERVPRRSPQITNAGLEVVQIGINVGMARQRSDNNVRGDLGKGNTVSAVPQRRQ